MPRKTKSSWLCVFFLFLVCRPVRAAGRGPGGGGGGGKRGPLAKYAHCTTPRRPRSCCASPCGTFNQPGLCSLRTQASKHPRLAGPAGGLAFACGCGRAARTGTTAGLQASKKLQMSPPEVALLFALADTSTSAPLPPQSTGDQQPSLRGGGSSTSSCWAASPHCASTFLPATIVELFCFILLACAASSAAKNDSESWHGSGWYDGGGYDGGMMGGGYKGGWEGGGYDGGGV
jgi:hypothetical protein